MSHHHHCHSHSHHKEDCCHDEHSCSAEHHECCSHSHDQECHFSKYLIELADQAWIELLKEKIKAEIESSNGKFLKELAKLVSNSNNARWKHKLAKQKVAKEFEGKLANLFDKA